MLAVHFDLSVFEFCTRELCHQRIEHRTICQLKSRSIVDQGITTHHHFNVRSFHYSLAQLVVFGFAHLDCTDAKRRIAACAHQKLFLCILVTLFADSQCISSWFIFKLQRVHTAIGVVNSEFLKWHRNAVLEEKRELGLHNHFLCYHLSEFKSDECFLLRITAANGKPHQQKNDGSCKKSFMFHSL